MVVRITNCCRMICTHCMNRSHPDGEHMSDKTLGEVIEFINKARPATLLISGGEPTEHPKFLEFIDKIIETGVPTILTTNGMFLENKEYTRNIFSKNIFIQITNDKRYYPIQIKDPKTSRVTYIDEIMSLSISGRAKDNKLKRLVTKAPLCFNLRSIARYVHKNNRFGIGGEICFKMALTILESKRKLCQPSINYDGTIVPGETTDCHVIGHVSDSIDSIFSNLINMKGCNNCTMLDVLTPLEKNAIGEE